MFKTVLLSLLLISTQVFASENMNMKMDKSKNEKTKKRKTLTDEAKKEVLEVLKANEELHASFVDYDGEKVEAASKKVVKAIEAVNDKEIKKLLAFSKGKLAEIKAKRDREDNNQSYHQFSMAVIHIVNTYDVGKEYNAYSCPMVKKKWVQNTSKDKKVNNPYASGMPHCGNQDTNH